MKFKNKKVSPNGISNFSYEFINLGEALFLSHPLTPHIQRFQIELMKVVTSGKDQENIVLDGLGLSPLLGQMYSAMFPNVDLYHHRFYQVLDPDHIPDHRRVQYGNDSIIAHTSITTRPSRDVLDDKPYQLTSLWIGPLVMENLFKAAQLSQRDFANLIIPTLLGQILKLTYGPTTTDISFDKDVRSLDAAVLLRRVHDRLVMENLNARRDFRYVAQKAPSYARMLLGEASLSHSLGDKDEPFIYSYKEILTRNYDIRVLNADRVPFLGRTHYFHEMMHYMVEEIIGKIIIPDRNRKYITMNIGDGCGQLYPHRSIISSFYDSNDYIFFSHAKIDRRNNVDPVDYYLRDIKWVESVDWESKIEDPVQREKAVVKYLEYVGYEHVADPQQ